MSEIKWYNSTEINRVEKRAANKPSEIQSYSFNDVVLEVSLPKFHEHKVDFELSETHDRQQFNRFIMNVNYPLNTN